MILSTILGPPGAPPEEETAGTTAPERRVLSVTRERYRRYERAVYIGVALSVLIHVLAIRLSPLVVRYLEPGALFDRVVRPLRPRAEGMQALEIRISDVPRVEPQPEPEPEPETEPEPPAPGVAEGAAAPTLSAAERLRPRVGDWRLWVVAPVPTRTDRTPAERAAEVEARLHARLEAYDDSLAAALAAEAEAMDWTVGEEGNKWGISPGKIHLGPVTLPLPFFIGPSREQMEQAREWEAIQRQAGQGEIDETFEDRVRAIRERKAQEEAENAAQRDTTSAR